MASASASSSAPLKAWIAFPSAPYTGESALRAAKQILGKHGWLIETGGAERAGEQAETKESTATNADESGEQTAPRDADLYFAEYDLLPFEEVHPGSDRLSDAQRKGKPAPLLSSYIIRKSLIRKNYLAHSLHVARVKGLTSKGRSYADNNDSSRDGGYEGGIAPPTWAFEATCADDLDELLADELYDVREALEANEQHHDVESRVWYILKPAMADQGMGIRLFDTIGALQAIFEEFEEESDDEDYEDGEGTGSMAAPRSATAIVTSQVRHFVIQKYLANPLLIQAPTLPSLHKFHLRAYVLAQGNLRVFLFNEMLALFAPTPYESPAPGRDATSLDLSCHLTNTSRQDDETSQSTVHLLDDLIGRRIGAIQGRQKDTRKDLTFGKAHRDAIRREAVSVIGDAFAACAQADRVHFQPWPHTWEIFGVDLMVTAESCQLSPDALRVWLLEINAQPDFAKTGARLQKTIDTLFERSLEIAVLCDDGGEKEASVNGVSKSPEIEETKNGRIGDGADDWQVGESRQSMTLCLDMARSAGGW